MFEEGARKIETLKTLCSLLGGGYQVRSATHPKLSVRRTCRSTVVRSTICRRCAARRRLRRYTVRTPVGSPRAESAGAARIVLRSSQRSHAFLPGGRTVATPTTYGLAQRSSHTASAMTVCRGGGDDFGALLRNPRSE
jgi:hypothetical protein